LVKNREVNRAAKSIDLPHTLRLQVLPQEQPGRPNLFAENRVMVVNNPFLLVEGKLQHQDNVISVKVETVEPLRLPSAAAASHDFH
jgi:hypothetical protein